MYIRLDASEWVPVTDERGVPTYPGDNPIFLPDVSFAGTVNGRAVHFSLKLRYKSGKYSGNVHSGIEGYTDYEVLGIEEV